MNKTDRKKGRCPRCCPDGGAYFRRELTADGWVWECNNCGTEIPCRKGPNREPAKPTATQERILERMLKNERLAAPELTRREMVGRKVFFVIEERGRPWLAAATIMGTIGPRGKLKAEYSTVGYKKAITDPVYLI